MATAQASHVTCDPISCLSEPYSLDSEPDNDFNMGSVGSLVEKQDFSPATLGSLRGMRQPDGLLRKGMSQREVFGYLHGGKRDTRAEKKHQSSVGGFKRDYESDRENQSPERYFRDNQRGADFSKSSLPERGRFDKMFEDKQRLWMEELEELKQMYVAKLQQVTQQAQRTQRALQLQLYKAQQEKKRLQEELEHQQSQCEELRQRQQQAERLSPKLEETKWEVCQKTAEISLLKQQIRDTQEEMTQKLGEIFSLKSQLREARTELQVKDSKLVHLGDSLQALPEHGSPLPPKDSPIQACQDFLGCETDDSKSRGMQGESAEGPEWLWAELLRERHQAQLQAANFEQERKTWQQEKEKVLRYQREIQANYMEMYHRNQALERQLSEFRQLQAETRGINSESPWIERVESSKI